MKKVMVTIPQQGWGSIKTKYPPDSILVALDELTGGSKNFDSTVRGILSKRLGGVNYDQTVDADGPNKDQFEAIFTDGVHHLLKVVAGKLKFSSGGGTFTTVTTGYSTLGNFEFAVYMDRVYFGNGIDAPQVYDRTASYGGVGYSVPQTKVMGTQVPGTAPTFAADTAGGNVPAGAHTYKVTFLYYDFEESNGGPASAVHTVVNPNNTVNLTSVPVGGYGVTARKIYRDDNDGVYRLVGTIANNTATIFTDTASTGTALIPLSNNTPPNFKYIVTNLDRTWIAGIPGDPSSLRFSEAGLPDIFPSANDILCNPEDPITALVVYDKKVWVFNRNSIGRILGSTRDTFQYVPLPGSVGCVDNRSIRVRTINGIPTLVWLSDKGFYGTNGSSVDYLSDDIEDLVNLNIQQAVQVKGQNAQTSQGQFQSGTPSPGIDLTSSPGFVTTPNPRRLWDDEADWEGGSSLTNVATNDNLNRISVVTKHAPAFADGSHANTIIQSGNLTLTQAANNTGASSTFSGLTFSVSGGTSVQFTRAMAAKVYIPRPGLITQIQFYPGADGGNGQAEFAVFTDSFGNPGSSMGAVTVSGIVGAPSVKTAAMSVNITTPGYYWIVCDFRNVNNSITTLRTDDPLVYGGVDGPSKCFINTGLGSWQNATRNGGVVNMNVWFNYSFIQTAVAATGQWTGPAYDSKSGSAVPVDVVHTGSYPALTGSTTTVEAADDDLFSVGLVSTATTNLNGSFAVALSNKRYWRIKIFLSTTDDRAVPTAGIPILNFSTTATWVSEVIDHTTDITTLDALTSITSIPSGMSVTVEIATSANNITYSAFTSLGMATPQRYSKVRITMSNSVDTTNTPYVTSAELDWTVVANLVSSAIDTGTTPAGWDLFQAQFSQNGGIVAFYVRSATTAPGLTAETFVAVTNGQFPTIPVRQFVQWKVVLTSTANAVPTVDSVTINWFTTTGSSLRVASLFYNRSYYLAASEFNQTTNNLLIVLDGEGKWRIYRGLFINTFSLFFNDPYYGSAAVGRIIRFLSPGTTTDQGTNIEMVVETKAIDFGDMEHTKVGRKVYLKGKNTGAVYQVYMSFDDGNTYYPLLDVETGLTSFTTGTDGKRFRRRFQLDFSLGNTVSGKTVKVKIVENTSASAEIDELKIQAWIRQGELVN